MPQTLITDWSVELVLMYKNRPALSRSTVHRMWSGISTVLTIDINSGWNAAVKPFCMIKVKVDVV